MGIQQGTVILPLQSPVLTKKKLTQSTVVLRILYKRASAPPDKSWLPPAQVEVYISLGNHQPWRPASLGNANSSPSYVTAFLYVISIRKAKERQLSKEDCSQTEDARGAVPWNTTIPQVSLNIVTRRCLSQPRWGTRMTRILDYVIGFTVAILRQHMIHNVSTVQNGLMTHFSEYCPPHGEAVCDRAVPCLFYRGWVIRSMLVCTMRPWASYLQGRAFSLSYLLVRCFNHSATTTGPSVLSELERGLSWVCCYKR